MIFNNILICAIKLLVVEFNNCYYFIQLIPYSLYGIDHNNRLVSESSQSSIVHRQSCQVELGWSTITTKCQPWIYHEPKNFRLKWFIFRSEIS